MKRSSSNQAEQQSIRPEVGYRIPPPTGMREASACSPVKANRCSLLGVPERISARTPALREERIMSFALRSALASALFLLAVFERANADEFTAALPEGVAANWNIADAYRQTTPTRERICINGL